jgi:hypothetical protein
MDAGRPGYLHIITCATLDITQQNRAQKLPAELEEFCGQWIILLNCSAVYFVNRFVLLQVEDGGICRFYSVNDRRYFIRSNA